MAKSKSISEEQIAELLQTLKARFEKNMQRHEGLAWEKIQSKLKEKPDKLNVLFSMEETGGEPDVVNLETDKICFVDCSKESPKGRRSLCYDKASWESRKKFKPENNAADIAKEIGIELLTEEQYSKLQTLGEFDNTTSSWLKTPDAVRKLGGAIFGDYRFGRVFIYHNGAESYYAARGFRGVLFV